MSTEHEQETEIGPSNGRVTAAEWRHLPIISSSGSF
jgi:hypothetical protein